MGRDSTRAGALSRPRPGVFGKPRLIAGALRTGRRVFFVAQRFPPGAAPKGAAGRHAAAPPDAGETLPPALMLPPRLYRVSLVGERLAAFNPGAEPARATPRAGRRPLQAVTGRRPWSVWRISEVRLADG